MCDSVLFFFTFKRQDARIIVGLFYETEARKVFCEVICAPVHFVTDLADIDLKYQNDYLYELNKKGYEVKSYIFVSQLRFLCHDEHITPGVNQAICIW